MIRENLKRRSREALKAGDRETRTLLSSILGKFTETEKGARFGGWTEALEQEVVARHVKGLRQGIEQMREGAVVDGYRKEVSLLEPYLPRLLDEAATRELVAPIAENARNIGQFMGMVMKQHRGQVDPQLVRRIGEELGLS